MIDEPQANGKVSRMRQWVLASHRSQPSSWHRQTFDGNLLSALIFVVDSSSSEGLPSQPANSSWPWPLITILSRSAKDNREGASYGGRTPFTWMFGASHAPFSGNS
jgi:hypothetical protein